jgi:hypothetical protein
MLTERILAGGLLLLLGRKLFWLYVAILGFVTGLTLSSQLFHIQPEWLQLAIGIGLGILGALLAYFFQEIAIAVAGFLGGAYVATSLLTTFAANPGPNGDLWVWGVYLFGGIIGAVLAVMLFDWALIILTSLAGALLVMEGLKLQMPLGWLVAAGLTIVGIIIQAGIQRSSRRTRSTTTNGT